MRADVEYAYLRNGSFYWRWPEQIWTLDRSLATLLDPRKRPTPIPLAYHVA